MAGVKDKTGRGVGSNQYDTRDRSGQTTKSLNVALPLGPSTEEMYQCLNDDYRQVTVIVANPRCQPDVIKAWAAVINQSLTDDSYYGGKVADHAGRVAAVLVANANCPTAVVDDLASANRAQVRAVAAASPKLSDTAWQRLLDFPPTSVKEIRGVMKNQRMRDTKHGPAMFRAIHEKSLGERTGIFAQFELVEKVECPVDLLVQYIASGSVALRQAAMAHPNCPDHIRTIGVLARD